jgi:hypothetical protein
MAVSTSNVCKRQFRACKLVLSSSLRKSMHLNTLHLAYGDVSQKANRHLWPDAQIIQEMLDADGEEDEDDVASDGDDDDDVLL